MKTKLLTLIYTGLVLVAATGGELPVNKAIIAEPKLHQIEGKTWLVVNFVNPSEIYYFYIDINILSDTKLQLSLGDKKIPLTEYGNRVKDPPPDIYGRSLLHIPPRSKVPLKYNMSELFESPAMEKGTRLKCTMELVVYNGKEGTRVIVDTDVVWP